MSTIATPRRTLLDASGRPVSPARPPEKMTAVKFIRKMAEDAGGVNTAHGQALHRLAMHFITLQEELARVGRLHDLSGDHSPERIDAAAKGIYMVAADQVSRQSGGQMTPEPWERVVQDRPAEADAYRAMATAALGGPVFPPAASPEDIG